MLSGIAVVYCTTKLAGKFPALMCTTHALVLEMRAASPSPIVHCAMCERAIKLKAQTATNNSGDLEVYRKAMHTV